MAALEMGINKGLPNRTNVSFPSPTGLLVTKNIALFKLPGVIYLPLPIDKVTTHQFSPLLSPTCLISLCLSVIGYRYLCHVTMSHSLGARQRQLMTLPLLTPMPLHPYPDSSSLYEILTNTSRLCKSSICTNTEMSFCDWLSPSLSSDDVSLGKDRFGIIPYKMNRQNVLVVKRSRG